MPTYNPAEQLLDLHLDAIDRQDEENEAELAELLGTASELIDELKNAGHPDAEWLAGEAAHATGDLEAAEGLVAHAQVLVEGLRKPVPAGAGR